VKIGKSVEKIEKKTFLKKKTKKKKVLFEYDSDDKSSKFSEKNSTTSTITLCKSLEKKEKYTKSDEI